MKKVFFSLITCAVFTSLLFNLTSCGKEDAGKLPNIAFKTTAGYAYTDTSVVSGDTINVGITASKAEEDDILKTLNIQHTVNSSTATVNDASVTLTTAQGDNYSQDFPLIPTGATNDTLKYTFTVSNRDGLLNNVKLNVRIK